MGLLIGLLIVNLLISCIVGWVSNQRGRSFWLGFWLSAFLSPLFGILVLIALPAREMRLQNPVAQDHVSATASELTALEGRPKRVQAIADDIVSGQSKYADIDAWELLEDVLELDLTGGDGIWTNQKVAHRVSLEDSSEETPIANSIELIFDRVDPARVAQWQAEIDAIAEGEQDADIDITEAECDLLEMAVTEQEIEDGGGFIIRTAILQGDRGGIVRVEVCIGDGGEPFDPIGPYGAADGLTNFTDDLVLGERY